ncbi:MAG: CotH kinase family protein [Acidimicrobiales bacterium]
MRLAVEHPDDEWVERVFGTDGSLYKAESTGDYSYRGDDAAEYEEVFDLESGDDETLEHLTAFLEFINESDDTTFAAELSSWLDVDAFATYLAMQDLVDNFDDIDGPGNNSYLYYDPSTDQMTVVPWDLNLAFGVMGGTPATDGTQAGGGQAGAPAMPAGNRWTCGRACGRRPAVAAASVARTCSSPASSRTRRSPP